MCDLQELSGVLPILANETSRSIVKLNSEPNCIRACISVIVATIEPDVELLLSPRCPAMYESF